MSQIIKIEVSQETVNYIQSIDYEVNSRKSLLILMADQLGIESKAFRDYEKEYILFDAEYQLVQEHLQSIYIPDELINNHELKWNLNSQTNLIIVEVFCDCGIELIKSGKLDFSPNFNDDLISKFSNNK